MHVAPSAQAWIGPASARLARLSPGTRIGCLVALDAGLAPLALVAASAYSGAPVTSGWLAAAALVVLAGGALSYATGAAHRRLRDLDAAAVLRTLAQAAALAAVAAVAGFADPAAAGVFACAYLVAALSARSVLRWILRAMHRAANGVPRVAIYGAGVTGLQVAAALARDDHLRPVAFIDDNPRLWGRTAAGLRIRRPADLPGMVREGRVTRVVVAIPSAAPARRKAILGRLKALGVEARVMPAFTELLLRGTSLPQDPRALLERDDVALDLGPLVAAYRGQAVLVSGAGGSIGSEICRQILQFEPRALVLLDLSEAALFTIHAALEREADERGIALTPVLGSVGDAPLVRRLLSGHGVDVVLHAAACKHVALVEANPLAGLANNVLGTDILAREAARAGVRRFVLVSSDKAIRPRGAMGATKRLGELVVQDLAARSHGTRFATVRFGNVIGSSGSVVPVFRRQIEEGGPVTLTDAHATRYFMSVEEAVRLVLVAGASASGGEVFALDMGRPLRIADLARSMIAAAGCTVRDAANPAGDIEIREIGLRKGERLHEPAVTEGARPSGIHPALWVAEPPGLAEIALAAILRAARAAVAEGSETDARALLDGFIAGRGTRTNLPAPRPAALSHAGCARTARNAATGTAAPTGNPPTETARAAR
jgi:FlaA1/EpsC-like NDP-sugar epimerase